MRANLRHSEAKSMLIAVACLTLLVTAAVAEEGLVNHWKFDGDYKDSVGKKHAWAIHTDVKGPPTWETGRIGQAVTLGDPYLYRIPRSVDLVS